MAWGENSGFHFHSFFEGVSVSYHMEEDRRVAGGSIKYQRHGEYRRQTAVGTKGRLWGTGVTAWNRGRHDRDGSDVFTHSIAIMTAPGMGKRGEDSQGG